MIVKVHDLRSSLPTGGTMTIVGTVSIQAVTAFAVDIAETLDMGYRNALATCLTPLRYIGSANSFRCNMAQSFQPRIFELRHDIRSMAVIDTPSANLNVWVLLLLEILACLAQLLTSRSSHHSRPPFAPSNSSLTKVRVLVLPSACLPSLLA